MTLGVADSLFWPGGGARGLPAEALAFLREAQVRRASRHRTLAQDTPISPGDRSRPQRSSPAGFARMLLVALCDAPTSRRLRHRLAGSPSTATVATSAR